MLYFQLSYVLCDMLQFLASRQDESTSSVFNDRAVTISSSPKISGFTLYALPLCKQSFAFPSLQNLVSVFLYI